MPFSRLSSKASVGFKHPILGLLVPCSANWTIQDLVVCSEKYLVCYFVLTCSSVRVTLVHVSSLLLEEPICFCLTLNLSVSLSVLHGDVYSVHPVCVTLVPVGCLLLEGLTEDPVLDSWSHLSGHGGEGCVLCWVREHQRCRGSLWVYTTTNTTTNTTTKLHRALCLSGLKSSKILCIGVWWRLCAEYENNGVRGSLWVYSTLHPALNLIQSHFPPYPFLLALTCPLFCKSVWSE